MESKSLEGEVADLSREYDGLLEKEAFLRQKLLSLAVKCARARDPDRIDDGQNQLPSYIKFL
jgi:hypothetical protein